MNYTKGLQKSDVMSDSNKSLDEILTPEYFISTVLLLKSLKDFYNINCLSLNDIDLSFKQIENPIFIILDTGIFQVKTNKSPFITISDKVNSIFNINNYYQYDGLSLVFIELFSKFEHKYSNNKRYYHSYISPFLNSFGENISNIIKNKNLEFLIIEELPSFKTLFEQSLSIFKDHITPINPPLVPYTNTNNTIITETSSNILKNIDGIENEYDKELTINFNNLLKSIQFNIDNITGNYNLYMFPMIESIPKNPEFESIFQYWLKGGKVNIRIQTFYKYIQFYNQGLLQKLFQNSIVLKLFKYPQTWSLNQVNSILNKDDLEQVCGKFLFSNKRSPQQNKILKSIITNFSTKDDITFYHECKKKYIHTEEFDRSNSRLKEMDRLNIWNHLKNVNKYLDYGGSVGENAVAISKKLKLTKENIFVSDVKSWFGNENVEKYSTLLTYRYLKSYKLPFEDNTFQFISAFQVFHHIRKYELVLREIHRILQPSGIFYIREHDCNSPQTAILIDIEHSLFEICGSNTVEYLQTYHANYFSKEELYSLLESIGFKQVINGNNKVESEITGITRYYLTLWKK